MKINEAILKRRSIRLYKNKEVSEKKIQLLMEAAMAAPSARNLQPWKFFIVKNKEKRQLLSKIFRDFNAPLMIVVAGDLTKLNDKNDEFWIQDCSAAVQNILLTATSIDLGTCWCGVYPKKKATAQVQEILDLSEETIPVALIQIGYPDEEKEARTQYKKENVVEII